MVDGLYRTYMHLLTYATYGPWSEEIRDTRVWSPAIMGHRIHSTLFGELAIGYSTTAVYGCHIYPSQSSRHSIARHPLLHLSKVHHLQTPHLSRLGLHH